ncbi:hypothetical protein EI546_01695 [Aequorivita sp. H23M31]|uniref:Uncharacterized protein n=1 Tax=Aequorivita ciconiae TaxID=2494375 RepID=A0A410FZT7_9FLAO|nr:hypothetical protein [Aequorivita sp. H23M31]QAA80519.1 hypothetical protein EI546_01695 [Aequorivita sp. H23M31]
MKLSGITYLIITSLILLMLTIFIYLDIPFSWIFYITVLGQIFLVISVYKILTDNYTTKKTFKDFYEDHPIGREEGYFENTD